MTDFIITYRFSIVNVQTNYCNINLLILDVKQLNKIMKLYYFYANYRVNEDNENHSDNKNEGMNEGILTIFFILSVRKIFFV